VLAAHKAAAVPAAHKAAAVLAAHKAAAVLAAHKAAAVLAAHKAAAHKTPAVPTAHKAAAVLAAAPKKKQMPRTVPALEQVQLAQRDALLAQLKERLPTTVREVVASASTGGACALRFLGACQTDRETHW
jgi:hypothetical protein